MARYLIELIHKPEECNRSMEEIMDEVPDYLDRFFCGCDSDDHRCWAFIEASNDSDARRLVPRTIYNSVHVVEVKQLTPEFIRQHTRNKSPVGKILEAITGKTETEKKKAEIYKID
jgi:hypothetical protein